MRRRDYKKEAITFCLWFYYVEKVSVCKHLILNQMRDENQNKLVHIYFPKDYKSSGVLWLTSN